MISIITRISFSANADKEHRRKCFAYIRHVKIRESILLLIIGGANDYGIDYRGHPSSNVVP